MAYLEQINLPDAVVLYNDTVMAPTVGPSIDTTGYGNIVVQVDCETQIQAIMEGTNDQLDWFPIYINPLNDLPVTDFIAAEGGYQFKTTFTYIRFNVSYCGGGDGCKFVIIGRAGQGDNAGDNIVAAFNPDTPINIAFGNGVKQDRNGALILSDGIPYYIPDNATYVINLNGYSAIYIQLSGAITVTATQSIDGTLWSASYFGLNSGVTLSNTPNAAGIWSGPVVGQYLRLVVTGAVGTQMTAAVVLKSTPMNAGYFNQGNQPANISQIAGAAVAAGTAQLGINMQNIAGTAAVNAGVAGTLAIGGNIAAGVAPTLNPVLTGGIDNAGLTRRILTDTTGRLITTVGNSAFGSAYFTNSNSPSANAAFPQNTIGVLPATYQQSAALNVQDTMQVEGLNSPEILTLILLELRILNQQINELPTAMASNSLLDPPDRYRQESSIFNI